MSTLEQQYVAESLQSIAKLHGSKSTSKPLHGSSVGATAMKRKKPKVNNSTAPPLSIASVNSSGNSCTNHRW